MYSRRVTNDAATPKVASNRVLRTLLLYQLAIGAKERPIRLLRLRTRCLPCRSSRLGPGPGIWYKSHVPSSSIVCKAGQTVQMVAFSHGPCAVLDSQLKNMSQPNPKRKHIDTRCIKIPWDLIVTPRPSCTRLHPQSRPPRGGEPSGYKHLPGCESTK